MHMVIFAHCYICTLIYLRIVIFAHGGMYLLYHREQTTLFDRIHRGDVPVDPRFQPLGRRLDKVPVMHNPTDAV